MEQNTKSYKGGNIIIGVLFIILMSMIIYCATIVGKEQLILILSIICIVAWGCLGYSYNKKLINNKNSNSKINVHSNSGNELVVSRNEEIPSCLIEEEEYRVDIINNALESTLMIVNENEEPIGLATIINDRGMALTYGYNLESSGLLKQFILEDEINFINNNTGDKLKGRVSKIIKDKNDNTFCIVKIEDKLITKHFVLGNSDKVNIGAKVFAMPTFNFTKSVNVIESVISQINQECKLSSNDGLIFNSHQCFLYNGISTNISKGGPMINIDGELVGILLGKSEKHDKLNYALPINEIKEEFNELSKEEVDIIDIGKSDNILEGNEDTVSTAYVVNEQLSNEIEESEIDNENGEPVDDMKPEEIEHENIAKAKDE